MGGIRFGEMERDSLLAHGASYCLNDRLMKCSDYSEGYVCAKCGSILSCFLNRQILRKNEKLGDAAPAFNPEDYPVKEDVKCSVCDTYDCRKVAIPYVLRYMTNELAAMGIRLNF
jgi:DNA-directed RNA polymerase I subunit RPA2